MSNVERLHNTGTIDPSALLEMAQGWELTEVVVLGRNTDGEYVWGSSEAEVRKILMHLEWAKFKMMQDCCNE